MDWSKITSCVQKQDETVSEHTEKICHSAAAYSGITDTWSIDNGPLGNGK